MKYYAKHNKREQCGGPINGSVDSICASEITYLELYEDAYWFPNNWEVE